MTSDDVEMFYSYRDYRQSHWFGSVLQSVTETPEPDAALNVTIVLSSSAAGSKSELLIFADLSMINHQETKARNQLQLEMFQQFNMKGETEATPLVT